VEGQTGGCAPSPLSFSEDSANHARVLHELFELSGQPAFTFCSHSEWLLSLKFFTLNFTSEESVCGATFIRTSRVAFLTRLGS
jgi:hypothetical protein